MKLELCTNCEQIETYRKCSECGNIPLCIICERNHKHKNPISQVMANHKKSIPNNDLEKVAIIQ